MKALSIRQPWVELILERKKTIEIRSWNTKFRGYFLIHSSKNIDKKAGDVYNIKPEKLPLGFIVGYAKLIDVVTYKSRDEFLKDVDKHLSISEPKKYPTYGFVLDDINRINLIEYNGKLGFFNVHELTRLNIL